MDQINEGQKTDVVSADEQQEDMKMEELLGPETNIEEGKIYKVKVAGKTSDGVMVDLGMKAEGLVEKAEFTEEQFNEIKPGSEISVYIIRLHTQQGTPMVSYKKAKEVAAWDKISLAVKNNQPVDGHIVKKIKGGFIVDIGLDAFLPASQLDIYQVKDFSKFLGITMKFLVTEFNRSENNVVLSRRKLVEFEQKEAKRKIFEVIEVGQEMEGIVSKIIDSGAFVDIGGMDGFVHISDIAWHRISKVKDALSERQNVKVKVLKIENDKVALGIKQLFPRPWDNAKNKYHVGDILKCKITSITEFGLFAQLEPGLEGLVHISEIAWNDPKGHGIKNFKKDQEIDLKIIAIDTVNEKISLSIKRTKQSPWDEARKLYPAGTRLKGVVTNLMPFGAFVKLPSGIEGLVHVSDMSWLKKVRHPQDMLKTGQEVEVVVLNVDTKEEKISLSLKHAEGNPFAKYAPGKIVTGKVVRIMDFGAFVELEPGIDALVRTSEISSAKISHPSEALKVGQEIEGKVLKCEEKEKKIDVSMRKLEHEREKELLKKYVNKNERHTLGDLLEENEESEEK
jgi:small subunit ribosomal protein S1